mmetsp:Transcript_10232/g.46959  ORF Transcript_10232/g.46959 Transcript_10232/m.46959 type:complete len:245 (+) Transcript_10232:401-1135(+)
MARSRQRVGARGGDIARWCRARETRPQLHARVHRTRGGRMEHHVRRRRRAHLPRRTKRVHDADHGAARDRRRFGVAQRADDRHHRNRPASQTVVLVTREGDGNADHRRGRACRLRGFNRIHVQRTRELDVPIQVRQSGCVLVTTRARRSSARAGGRVADDEPRRHRRRRRDQDRPPGPHEQNTSRPSRGWRVQLARVRTRRDDGWRDARRDTRRDPRRWFERDAGWWRRWELYGAGDVCRVRGG